MKKQDHKLLARLLLRREEGLGLDRYQTLFLAGCVAPDYNLLSYLRGSMRVRMLRGHNAENVLPHLKSSMERLQNARKQSAYWYFTLGTLMHYVADCFTYPHNSAFPGSLIKHREYECSLHREFVRELSEHELDGLSIRPRSPWDELTQRHSQYVCKAGDMETDCYFIVKTCQDILAALLGADPTGCPAALI